MDITSFLFGLAFFLVLLGTVPGDPVSVHGRIVYTRDQLLAAVSRGMLTERPDVPCELRWRRRARPASVKLRAKRRRY